jgi:hypothetical protein
MTRYSLKTISSTNYQQFTISGSTLLGTTSSLNSGYIFAPYITVDKIILDREFFKKILREERIEKLNKLKKISEI